jgi:Ca2+-transporting ATPase
MPYADAPHASHVTHVLRGLDVDAARGLPGSEVVRRRAKYGENVLPQVRSRQLGRMIADQLLNVVVLLLAAAAIIAWVTGDHAEAGAIAVVLVLNSIIGFATEWQAGRALEALRKQTHITTSVRRDGRMTNIPAEELVVGDIVLLSAGDRVPADLRLIEAESLRAEEASLTGESKSVFKSAEVVALDASIAERSSMVFLGTVITTGRAVAIVVATGEQTELGKIGRLVIDVPTESTPLQRKLDALGRRLVWIVLAIAAVVGIAGLLRGDPLWTMVEVSISLAVAAVPEALPAVTTFILAFGVLAMARRKAIVRRLTAVETLGSTTVICADKTGTLTLNRMTVTEIEGDEAAVLRIAALCNDATAESGDPTEKALVHAALERRIDVEALRREWPRVAEVPFDPATKRMVTVHRGPQGFLWALKGAPEVVFEACGIPVSESNTAMASRGLRVLAFAEKTASSLQDDTPYTFRGLIGMIDPPRPGVLEAVATAKSAGLRVIMLTGDQADTAHAIARELRLDDVHARISPEEKYRIVEKLQASGEVVAVTGDGVNDAPALKKADVGIAMGERGTEVAKEAADIVLADDNFATIVAAIEGGRAIYANIRKFVHMMFSHNIAEVLTVFVAIVAGWPLPLLPLQILWMNLVTDIFPAFALALEPASKDVMQVPPRDPRESLLSGPFLVLISWQAAMLATISLSAYGIALVRYGGGAHARTVALLALVGVQMGQTFNCRSRTRSAFDCVLSSPHLWLATATVIGLQAAAVYVPALRDVLGTVTPGLADVAMFVLAVVLPIAIVETQKAFARRGHAAADSRTSART